MLKRLLNQLEEAVISLLLVAMTLLVFVEVVLRFGFNTGLSWSQELTLHLSAWFVLFGISYGLKTGVHINVDAFVRLFPPLGRRLLGLLAVLLSLGYCAAFITGSWLYLRKMFEIGVPLEDLEFAPWMIEWMAPETAESLHIYIDDPLIPLWLAHGVLLLGLVMFSVRLLLLLWRVATGHSTGFGHRDEASESMALADELRRGPGK